jgi:hypothetical protein
MNTQDKISKHFPPEVIRRYEMAVELFMEKSFTKKDIEPSNRVISHWYKEGILGDGDVIREKRKFSMIEYCWIKIVMEMRSFNIPFEIIRNIKNVLMTVIDFQQIRQLDHEAFEIGIELANPNYNKLNDLGVKDEEIQDIFRDINYSYLYFFIIQAIASRDSWSLLINAKGEYFPFNHKMLDDLLEDPDLKKFYSESYISISINSIIKDLIKKIDKVDKIKNKNTAQQERLKGVLMTKNEMKVHELVSKNDFKEITVIYENESTVKIKANKSKSTINTELFINYIYDKAYTEIIVTTKTDKKIHIRK